MQVDLFGDAAADATATWPTGLHYVPDFLSRPERDVLLHRIDATPWRADLRRRVQHYGWRYDYRSRRVAPSDRIGPLPYWLGAIAADLARDGHFGRVPDQAIVNEYLAGQGIAAHVDCEPCFGGVVASLSLGSPVLMELAPLGGCEQISVDLAPGSLLVLSGEVRHAWTHAIAARKSDVIGGVRRPRGRRVSVTFRTVRV